LFGVRGRGSAARRPPTMKRTSIGACRRIAAAVLAARQPFDAVVAQVVQQGAERELVAPGDLRRGWHAAARCAGRRCRPRPADRSSRAARGRPPRSRGRARAPPAARSTRPRRWRAGPAPGR
jgi:hypothetical protein